VIVACGVYLARPKMLGWLLPMSLGVCIISQANGIMILNMVGLTFRAPMR
jgi:hypothetical protein